MPRTRVVLPLGLALAIAGCMRHGLPADRSVEAHFPGAAVPALPELQPLPPATPPVVASASAAPSPLRVVTFNVHMQPGERIAHALQHDRALRDADVIVMEEIHRKPGPCSAACVIARQLGYYEVYAPGHGTADGGDDGVAILSRTPITSSEVIVLPFFDVHINSGRRIAMAATIEVAGQPITVYAVHLENRLDVRDRRTQMMPVLAHARRQQTPVIIAGDFNTSPFTWIAHVIPVLTTTQDDRFEELVRSQGFATPVADAGATHRYLAMKLDGIYTKGFQTRKFATADAEDVSDHLALWATMVRSPR